MQKSVLCLILSFAIAFFPFAQAPGIQWQKTIGGSNEEFTEFGFGFYVPTKVHLKASNGNTIVAGEAESFRQLLIIK